MKKDSIKAWAQLLRIPNGFTALADVIAGALLALGRWPEGDEVLTLVRVCFASACLYSAGMVLNDFFDVEEDTRDRPFRPIPSGRVGRKAAGSVGFVLLAVGLILGLSWNLSVPWESTTLVAPALATMIFFYDAWLKHTSLGPAAMGSCRFLNFLMGASQFHGLNVILYWAAALVGCYIVGVTYFAKSEVKKTKQIELFTGVLLMAIAILDLFSPLLYSLDAPSSNAATVTILVVVELAFLLAFIFVKVLSSLLLTNPNRVQTIVKVCIFGLIGLDTIFACAAAGPSGLFLLLLLIPSIILGRFIYST